MRIDVRKNPADAHYSVVRAETGESLDWMGLVMADDETGEYARYADRGMPGHIPIGDDGKPIIDTGKFAFPIKLVPIVLGSHRENLDQKIPERR